MTAIVSRTCLLIRLECPVRGEGGGSLDEIVVLVLAPGKSVCYDWLVTGRKITRVVHVIRAVAVPLGA